MIHTEQRIYRGRYLGGGSYYVVAYRSLTKPPKRSNRADRQNLQTSLDLILFLVRCLNLLNRGG